MSFNVSSYPGRSLNPYLDLFYEALEPYGVKVGEPFVASPRWVIANRHAIDAVHWHWPEGMWRGARRGRSLARLWAVLKLAGKFGIKRVWTVHNVEPHEASGYVDRCGQRLLARHCDLLIVHSELAAEHVRARLHPRTPVVVMPHGNYSGHYPEARPREAVLAELGVPVERPVVCCPGWMRDYKGLDVACEALNHLSGVHLVIAGPPHNSFDSSWLVAEADARPDLTLLARRLDDQEFVDLLSISDAVFMPYRNITGSGVLSAALTQGRGVVASDLGYFREVLDGHPDAGRLFRTGDPGAAAAAIGSYLALPAERRRAAALALAAEYDWERCVRPVGEVFRRWSHERHAATPPRRERAG